MSEDRESRILVISASLDQGRTAIKLIKALVDDPSDLPPSSNFIPWTIRNKYYSADVHFHLVEYAHWDPQSAQRVPAVIFVWARGQPYAEHVFALQNGLSRFEPEVALAIALGYEPPHPNDPPEGPDSFLADHGFEYIDGERTRRPEMASASASPSEENGEDNDNDDDDDVQGLSRVVDALSTIMWPMMVRERDSGSKRKSELRPSLFDFDDAVLLAEAGEEEDEEETLAALMEADAAEQGAPQTRASRMRKEMAALERWLVENEELHEAEFGGAGVDDGDGGDEDEDEDEDHVGVSDSGDAPPPSVQASASAAAASSDTHTHIDDPWTAPTTSNPTSTRTPSTAPASHVSISITTPMSGFDDDFSAFVSAPPSTVSISGDSAAAAKTTTTGTATTTTASASEPIADAHRLHTQTQLLRPSHTGGSIRSIRSAVSEMSISDIGYDLGGGGGYEALDDRSNSSLNFSPEHEHDDDDDADPHASIGGQRSGDRTASLGDVPFDLPNILNALQTIREDVAGIENEAERRATTARFASEFVFNRIGVDGDEREEVEG